MVIELKWLWDEEKNQINQRKHGLSFEAAQYVFADPFAVSLPDPYPHEERWRTVGLIGQDEGYQTSINRVLREYVTQRQT